jgi:hypothetical protein
MLQCRLEDGSLPRLAAAETLTDEPDQRRQPVFAADYQSLGTLCGHSQRRGRGKI